MRIRSLLVLALAVSACDSNSSSKVSTLPDGAPGTTGGSGGRGGSGGSSGTGGSTSTGGATGTGGATSTGGASGMGGATGTSGASATGGVTAMGGATAKGGATGTGGATGSGGATGTGGGTATGGATGTGGGATGTGGARADGGPDAGPDAPGDATLDARRDGRADTTTATGLDAVTGDGAPCPYSGHVTYTLAKSANPTAAEQNAYDLITPAMDTAVYYYNCYTNITKALNVSYNSSVQTADGNINGSIRFGGTAYMEYVTAMHEISHTVGIGTNSNWLSFVAIPDGGSSGPWTGANATAELRAITGKATDTLTADTQHFWPYGLNYASEWHSEADGIDHCRIVMALRKDMGM